MNLWFCWLTNHIAQSLINWDPTIGEQAWNECREKSSLLLQVSTMKIKRLVYVSCRKLSIFGNTQIYGIESFWAFAKLRLTKFKGISKRTFYLHLKETEFRFNHRNDDLYKKLLFMLRNNPIWTLNFLRPPKSLLLCTDNKVNCSNDTLSINNSHII